MIEFNQENCILWLWTSEFMCQYECRQFFQKSDLNHHIFEKLVNDLRGHEIFFSFVYIVYSFF